MRNHMEYKKRVIDKKLDLYSQAIGGINILGPKGCGKTRTARERCNTTIAFQDPDLGARYIEIASIKPTTFLKYKKPILFDEWQDAPSIWSLVRSEADKDSCFGEFYLTGSSSKKVKVSHTGTARIATIEMLPMSLYETDESNGNISLKELFDNPNMDIDGIKSDLSMDALIYAMCRGGWPSTLAIKNKEAKLVIAKDYFKQIYTTDITHIDNTTRKPDWAKAIIQSYARNTGTLVKKATLLRDSAFALGFSEDTFDEYVSKLKELYVIEDIESWCPQIRSSKNLRSAKKRMFIDPSIAIAALGINPDYFNKDFDTLGHIFETLVFRDLKVYSDALGGKMSHYHDSLDLEVDGVLHLEDGRYALIEIKLGGKNIEKGIDNLLKVKDLIKKHNLDLSKEQIRIPEPTLLLVITATEFAFTSPDGVKIIPIGCIKD